MNDALQAQKQAEEELQECLEGSCVAEALAAIGATVATLSQYSGVQSASASWWAGQITTKALATNPAVLGFAAGASAAVAAGITFYECATDDCSDEKLDLLQANILVDMARADYQQARAALESVCD